MRAPSSNAGRFHPGIPPVRHAFMAPAAKLLSSEWFWIDEPSHHVTREAGDVVVIGVVSERPRPCNRAHREYCAPVRRLVEHHVGVIGWLAGGSLIYTSTG